MFAKDKVRASRQLQNDEPTLASQDTIEMAAKRVSSIHRTAAESEVYDVT